jgi:uncharacterized membrane protein YeaQ/YmgE (transglycosylase-associated protein family)
MLLFYSMSPLHIAVGFFIGAVIGYLIGCFYNVVNLKRGQYIFNFVVLSILGAFFADLFFSFLVNNSLLPQWFYYRPVIILEQTVGAIAFPILVFKPFIEFKPPKFKDKRG